MRDAENEAESRALLTQHPRLSLISSNAAGGSTQLRALPEKYKLPLPGRAR